MINQFVLLAAATLAVDFNDEVGKVRPELHSSGFCPTICSCSEQNIADIRAMGFHSARTHDWALINPNQRVCDWHHIFPLPEKDAGDPSNYYFAATDYLLQRTREMMGHDVFFRLGTSIEHSGKEHHFNATVPKDFDKVAEVFAGTVRHYNRGWANGFDWGIRYWEIWNEPDGVDNMWFDRELSNGGDAGHEKLKRKFAVLFAKCIKRMKDEFGDSIKVGGPALCWMNAQYFEALREECDRVGVKPDFISWHSYCEDPGSLLDGIAAARKMCDGFGWKDCELVLNEWHYFSYSDYDWLKLRSSDPETVRRIWTGPRSHNGIDSSCFNLAVLAGYQYSDVSLGFYYGCNKVGSWGYMDQQQRKYKIFYGLCMFGDFLKLGCDVLCKSGRFDPEGASMLTAVATKSADGKKRALLVSDYRVRTKEIVIDVAGVPADAKVKAEVHDYTRDRAPADFTFKDGKLTLVKPDEESAAWLITFE